VAICWMTLIGACCQCRECVAVAPAHDDVVVAALTAVPSNTMAILISVCCRWQGFVVCARCRS
jgi:hypothetical protein